MKLYPVEWFGMWNYIATKELHAQHRATYGGDEKFDCEKAAILELAKKIRKSSQAESWNEKKTRKLYNYSLPLSVSLALHSDMQRNRLSHYQQDFLSKLDERLKSKGFLQTETIHVEGKAGWEVDIHEPCSGHECRIKRTGEPCRLCEKKLEEQIP